MGFRVLPPGLAQRLIEGYEDELTPLMDKRNYRIKSTPCIRCKGNQHPFLDPDRAFSPDSPLPRIFGKCVDCGAVWDPETNLVHSVGDPRKIEDPLPIIKPRDD